MEQTNLNIAAIKALDGKIFAMLNKDELQVLNFYRDRGRKYGVTVEIINMAEAIAFENEEADHILRSVNSRIKITVV